MVPVFVDNQHNENISQESHNTSDENEGSRTTEDPVTKNRRNKRKSAIKQRKLMESLVDSSLLKVSLEEKAPTHPFNYKDWIKLLDDDVDVRKPKTMRKIKPETYEVDDHNNGDLIWDHSPQNVNSEADYNWSDALTPRNPADFVRLFTDELIEEAIESDETIVTDSGTDDDDFPNDKDELQTTRRLLSSTSANFLDPEFPVRTPLLPETVNLERVQNLNPALELATALLPDLVDPN